MRRRGSRSLRWLRKRRTASWWRSECTTTAASQYGTIMADSWVEDYRSTGLAAPPDCMSLTIEKLIWLNTRKRLKNGNLSPANTIASPISCQPSAWIDFALRMAPIWRTNSRKLNLRLWTKISLSVDANSGLPSYCQHWPATLHSNCNAQSCIRLTRVS